MKTIPTILLVDDEPDLLDNLSLTLEMAGYQPVTATDGFEALGILQSRPVNLILTDINMPNMGGYQLYKAVRQNSQWNEIPFLFLTGCRFVSDGEVRYGKAMGIEEYLIKPISAQALLTMMSDKLHPLEIVTEAQISPPSKL